MCKDSSAKYYKYNKERLQKRLMKDIKVFFKMEKKKKQQYCCELYRNLPEDEEYRKNCSTIVSIMCNIKEIKNE